MTMKSIFQALAAMACGAFLSVPASAAEGLKLDSEGYVRDWIMLAPIPLPQGGMAGDLLLREQVKSEATLAPKDGDEVTVNGRKLTWKRVVASTNYFDFNAVLKSQNDQAAGFLVTYVECDREIPNVTLAVASNDQGRIYFNGVDIYSFTEARPLLLDADKGRVTLKKGVNVFVFKVLNEQNSWQAAMRFMEKSGAPLKDVRIRVAP
jgi:hypothetical protein